jgi:DNA-binding Lrp family transcriptional regulator
MQLEELKSKMVESYGIDEPIIIKQIDAKEEYGMSQASLRKAFERLEANGYMKRFESGVYYFPKYSALFKSDSPLRVDKVIEKKYIQTNKGTDGYISGIGLLNSLGLSTQVPRVKEIVTNNTSKSMTVVEGKGQKVMLVKAKQKVTEENYRYLQLFEIIDRWWPYIERNEDEALHELELYLSGIKKKVTRNQLIEWLSYYPVKVAATMLDLKFERLLPEV